MYLFIVVADYKTKERSENSTASCARSVLPGYLSDRIPVVPQCGRCSCCPRATAVSPCPTAVSPCPTAGAALCGEHSAGLVVWLAVLHQAVGDVAAFEDMFVVAFFRKRVHCPGNHLNPLGSPVPDVVPAGNRQYKQG